MNLPKPKISYTRKKPLLKFAILQGEITCGPGTVVTTDQEREAFVEGQNYLRGLGAVCGAEVGKCARVSCSNDAAIWLCNNTGEELRDMECGVFADYVDHIFDQCQQDGLYAVDFAVGRQDNTEGWNVQAGLNAC